MERKLIRKKITSYGIRLLYIFSLVFYGLNLFFAVTLLNYSKWIGNPDTGFHIPYLESGQEYLIINVAGTGVLILIVSGIILLMRARIGGAYLFYAGNILMIVYFLIRPEPDWYTSSIVLLLCLLFLIPVRLIGTHSKLLSSGSGESPASTS
jgi:hypothetical protein